MGFLEIITIILILLKLTGFIHVSWWTLCLPEIIAISIYLIIYICIISKIKKAEREIEEDVIHGKNTNER